MTSRHDHLVDLVEELLHEQGLTNTHKLVPYDINGVCGEIDLYMIEDDTVWIFEMKSSDRVRNRNKAIEQVLRAETHYFRNKVVHRYYVYYVSKNSDEYKIEYIYK